MRERVQGAPEKAVLIAAVSYLFRKESDDLVYRYPGSQEEMDEGCRLMDVANELWNRAEELGSPGQEIHVQAMKWLGVIR